MASLCANGLPTDPALARTHRRSATYNPLQRHKSDASTDEGVETEYLESVGLITCDNPNQIDEGNTKEDDWDKIEWKLTRYSSGSSRWSANPFTKPEGVSYLLCWS